MSKEELENYSIVELETILDCFEKLEELGFRTAEDSTICSIRKEYNRRAENED